MVQIQQTLETEIDAFPKKGFLVKSSKTGVNEQVKEIPIRNKSYIDALILLLQQKFKMSKETLEQWRGNITFELRDNSNY